jgi:hypothetical protein
LIGKAEPHGDLKSVIVIMRHGDRKPKEKLKFKTSHPLFLQYVFQGEDFPHPVGAPAATTRSEHSKQQLVER